MTFECLTETIPMRSDKPLIVLTGGKNSDEILSNSLTKQGFDEFREFGYSNFRDDSLASPLEGNKSSYATADTIFRRNARMRCGEKSLRATRKLIF